MKKGKPRVTRRQVLIGAGAGAFGIGLGSGHTSAATSTAKWTHETDIVVVGSGAAASTVAIVARDNGDEVIIIDKAALPGGTSAKSAGVLWIPNNFVLKQKGIEDTKRECLEYLARYSCPQEFNSALPRLGLEASAFALLEAFYDNASAAVDALQTSGALKLAEYRMFHVDRAAPDYLDHVPENKVSTGRALAALNDDGSLGLGAHLVQQLHSALRARRVPLMLEHRAVRLRIDDAGRAVGLEARYGAETVALRARKAVIFATGGYVHNPKLVAHYQRDPLYGSCAMPAATGDLIKIAGAAGARLGNMGSAWRSQIVLELALASRHLASTVFMPPGDSMIQVNRYGRRVVNENRNYNDRTEVHGVYDASQADFPNQLLFMIYDQRTAQAFAGAHPLPEQPATGAPYVLQAGSLDDLAARMKIRLAAISHQTGGFTLDASFAENLRATVARFNAFARAGVDRDFDRGKANYDREWHLLFSPMRANSEWARESPNVTMHPFRAQGPYYAIILAAGALDTNGGPVIDASARLLDIHDQPIPGLYGAGNCIASPARDAYWGAGCTLGLALTFGYIAANAAHLERPT